MRNIADILGTSVGLATGDVHDRVTGTGKSGPRGIESVLEYNGLFMNVREWVDTYLVTTIGGIDDADIRDVREVNPGYHGETAFESFYGGRTITLSGKVYSKTLFKLRDMQQGLRQAFAQLDQEMPLVFRTNDPDLDMMIYAKKSQSVQMADEQRTANHFERPFLVTLRASNPRFLSVVKVHDTLNFTNLQDFTANPHVVTTEDFSSINVLNIYNEHGGGFTVSGGKLVSANKETVRNYVERPDFDILQQYYSGIQVYNGVLTMVPTGGAIDNGAYGQVSIQGNPTYLWWTCRDFETNKQWFSGGVRVRSPSTPCRAWVEVEWLYFDNQLDSYKTLSKQQSASIITSGDWQEIRMESILLPATAEQASWKVYFDAPLTTVHHVDKGIFTDQKTLPYNGYFDGDHPLAFWEQSTSPGDSRTIQPPYSVLTTTREFTEPMMTAKITTPATFPGSAAYVPRGVRFVLSYIDDGNQVYVEPRPYYNNGPWETHLYITVFRNGVREVDLRCNSINLAASTTYWMRGWIKNGVVRVEWNTKDPNTDPTYWASSFFGEYVLTAQQAPVFQTATPLQLIAFDEDYGGTHSNYAIDDWMYSSVDDLNEWFFLPDPGDGRAFRPNLLYIKNNRITPLDRNPRAAMIRTDLPYKVGDSTMSLKVRYDDPIGSNGIYIGIIGKYLDVNNYIWATIERTNIVNSGYVRVMKYENASLNFAAQTAIVLTDWPEDADRWLRFVINGNTFTSEFWKTDPALGGAATATATTTFTGATATKFGTGVKGGVGLYLRDLEPLTATVDDLRIALSGFSDTTFISVNEGNFRAQPVIELTGPLTNPKITNEANHEWISIPTTIPNGETWVLDIAAFRLYRKSDMANRFQYLDVNSDWMELEPGQNPISFTATGMGAASGITVDFHHTVM